MAGGLAGIGQGQRQGLALGEIGCDGWATSEVSCGGEAEPADIAARMKRVLGVG